jgi:mono/diheme cytochrome c family protein
MNRWVSLVGTIAGALMLALLAPSLAAQTRSPEPRPSLVESVAGRDSFEFYCASCHGMNATGDGPVASALRTRPADLTTLARRNGGAFPRERVVDFVTGTGRTLAAHGTTEMPIWGPLFRAFDPSDARVRVRIDNLVTYLESLQVPSSGAGDLGSQLFRTYCASCHGSDARGAGPMADTLRRIPPDLTQFATRNGGVFPSERLYAIIDGRGVASHGDREMPVWGDAFRTVRDGFSASTVKARIDAIVRYLAAIQGRGA